MLIGIYFLYSIEIISTISTTFCDFRKFLG